MDVIVTQENGGITAYEKLTGFLYRFDIMGRPLQGRPPKNIMRAVRRFVKSRN